MEKKSKVAQILTSIKDQTEELLDNESTEEMSAEEIVVLATELVVNSPVTTIEYSSIVGTVDRSKVSFMLDDEFEFPLFTEEEYDES